MARIVSCCVAMMATSVAIAAGAVKGMEDPLAAIRRLSLEIAAVVETPGCNTVHMGRGFGGHAVCDTPPRQPCTFYSFGTQWDYSFDLDLAYKWGCKGVALDPSVIHPSQLGPNITFMNVAATTLDATADAQWTHVTTVPALRRFLKVRSTRSFVCLSTH